MEVRIRIIDTLEDTHVYTLEKAEGGSIIVDWKGTDRKDDLNIVGSTLSMRMAKLSREDGAYYDLFTGDETRYRVIMDLADESYTIWQGFLLPDSYSEPYSNSPILVDVVASDGLGRLKGKFLPEDFYEEEKSVVAILSECLKLTGVGLDLRFAPAIENTQQKDYTQVYIDTRYYLDDNDKKEDAYSILSDLLESMLCTVYQADNHYNIEGLNIRERRVYNSKIYDADGVFIEEQEITRLQKDITGTGKPEITMQPPYGIVDITHDKEDISFPETLSQEVNDGWVLSRGTFHFIYATDWFGYNGFYAKAAEYRDDGVNPFPDRDNYQVYFERGDSSSQYMTLRNRPYVETGKKYRLKLDFRVLPFTYITDVTKQVLIDEGFWTNPFNLQISILYENEEGIVVTSPIFANYGVEEDGNRYIEQAFGDDEVVINDLEFIPPKSGVLSIQIAPIDDIGNGIEFVGIEAAELETIGFDNTYRSQITLNEDYTVKKEMTLTYADDATGFSKGFRLQRLREKDKFREIDIPVIRGFERDGWNYIVVSLASANLVKENPDEFYSGTNNINVNDVIYNYNNSDEHVIQSTNPVTGGVLTVKVYDFNTIDENRTYWEQWTDSIYRIEKIRYTDAYANIYNRLFDRPTPAMPNFRLKDNVKFNDFVNFNWRNKKQWIVTNCKWDVDKGFTDVSTVANYYAVEPQTNIPPVVEAGNDIQIETETQFQLTSEAYDPDGFISSYLWTEITSTGATINAPNSQNTIITNFTEDFATFEVTVTDNEGATASDTVNVFRVEDHELILTEIETNVWQVTFNPNISAGSAVNIIGRLNVGLVINEGTSGEAYARIEINGDQVQEIRVVYQQSESSTPGKVEDFSINMFSDDVVTFHLGATATFPDSKYAEFRIDEVDFVEGQGEITGTPQTVFIN